MFGVAPDHRGASGPSRAPQCRMQITLRTIITSWGTEPKRSLPIQSYVWALSMFGILAFLEFNKIGLYLVPPFAATLSILLLLPEAPVAQPYALIVGSVVGASIG